MELSASPGYTTRVTALIPALAAEDRIVRQVAAEILGRLGPDAQAAIPALVRALHDSHGWVREAAAQALQKIDPHENQSRP